MSSAPWHVHSPSRRAGGVASLFALEGTQPELRAEAVGRLRPRTAGPPDAETPWETAQGTQVRLLLYRTTEIAGYHDWAHLRQAWLVVLETRQPDGHIEVEERFFPTSLRPGRLNAAQCVQVVRGRWGVENDCFWSLDTQWREDDRPWCTAGRGVEVVSLLRLMAYNLLQLARKRHLRERRPDSGRAEPPAWRRTFARVRQALRLPLPLASAAPSAA